MSEGYEDSSGLRLYYTAERREYDAGVLIVGQTVLAIPPGQAEFPVQGDCPQQCTESLSRDVILTRGTVHMHYQGLFFIYCRPKLKKTVLSFWPVFQSVFHLVFIYYRVYIYNIQPRNDKDT